MKKLLSVAVAAVFAAASLNVSAQSKDGAKEDVKTKSGGSVTTKDGKDVTTKPVKDTPKAAPKAKKAKPAAAKPKVKGSDVKTKSGGPVTTKDGKDVTTTGK
jgi:cytochrome oxidase Cu insertion factor (SCO1/SenC/PrrC family)